jgi:hypothetical protein
LNYPIVIGNEALASKYGALHNMPVSVLIDRDGKIADSHAGVVERDNWEEKIAQGKSCRQFGSKVTRSALSGNWFHSVRIGRPVSSSYQPKSFC